VTQPQSAAAPAPVITGGAMVAGGAALTGSASLAAQASLAAGFYSSQAFLAAASVRDILTVWSQLNQQDVRSSWPALRTALSALIQNRYSQAAALGTTYYQQARQAAGVPGVADLAAPEVPGDDLIGATLDATGPYGMLGRIKAGQQVTQAAQNSGVIMAGAGQRLITNGARQAVLQSVSADKRAVAWMRVTSANPCSFCSLLASRGAVYRSEASAGFEAHSHCMCVAAPVFSHADAQATRNNPLYQQYKQATKGTSGQDAMNAWRRYWDGQQNRDGVRVLPPAA
jgi:hypothetical protein